LQDAPEFTQIGIFGVKTNHLATLAKFALSQERLFNAYFGTIIRDLLFVSCNLATDVCSTTITYLFCLQMTNFRHLHFFLSDRHFFD
jgi:hypothetical protein